MKYLEYLKLPICVAVCMVGFTAEVYAVDVRSRSRRRLGHRLRRCRRLRRGLGWRSFGERRNWIDKLLTDNLSLGLQYLYLSNTLSFSDSDDQHTRIHAGMLNAAWRMNNGVVHPYIGGGVGFGVTTVEFAPDEDDTATAVAG